MQFPMPIPAPGQSARIPSLAAGKDSLTLAQLGQQLAAAKNKQPLVIITAGAFEAQRLLEADLAFYCERAGHAAPPLRLSRAQRRWGSCSDRKAIRINWRLVQAPDAVRRSVVAHEVAHLTHFDHSGAFHAMLRALFEDDVGEADRWLKAHGRSLYASFG